MKSFRMGLVILILQESSNSFSDLTGVISLAGVGGGNPGQVDSKTHPLSSSSEKGLGNKQSLLF